MPSIAQCTIMNSTRFSFYLARVLTAYPEEAAALKKNFKRPFSLEEMQSLLSTKEDTDCQELGCALRRLRRQILARLIVRDLSGHAQLDEVLRTMTIFAQYAIEQALHAATLACCRDYGTPIGAESGKEQALIVVGMGKLGGRELNVSSDIDLIFIYPENGCTHGARSISNQEYFSEVGKRLIALLNDVTAEGQVFRVDMRLRPYGESGPLVMSYAALENYLLTQGREWERYAWIKARALTGDTEGLAQLVSPFVYRKYLDYGAYAAMRELSSQIRREVAERALADNIKLGPGGIREIEFIAQVFQLIRGGRDKSLQLKGTRETLERLAILGLITPITLRELMAAYDFLRRLEHRLQYIDDQQTQTLTRDPEHSALIAHSMGYTSTEQFLQQLSFHRQNVTLHFEDVFLLSTDSTHDHFLAPIWRDIDQHDIRPTLKQLAYQDLDYVADLLTRLAKSQRYQRMALANRKNFDGLMGPLIHVSSKLPNPDTTLGRIVTLMEAISRRAPYLALLIEYPHTLKRLASLLSASAWVSNYLVQHPILLDELLDTRVLYSHPDWPMLRAELDTQLEACGHDIESKMENLRHFQHAQAFRLVAQDLAGLWSVEALADELSLLADHILDATLQHSWLDLAPTHTPTPHFAVIAYGKLGGKELGYASDLDLIFLYDDAHPDAAEVYARLARKMVSWLTSSTANGILYNIDLRLRPNGTSGLLVSSVQSFEQYQRQYAWVWEHQALTRARYVAGAAFVGERFESVRQAILMQKRDETALKHEVVNMRERIIQQHPALSDDVKYARGGLVDIEFIVQYLVLAHAHHVPRLRQNTGNLALLAVAAEEGLIPEDLAEQARHAYRYYRRIQHATRLNEDHSAAPESQAELLKHYQQGRALWRWFSEDRKQKTEVRGGNASA